MESASWWSELLDAYLASPDAIKALWLLVPPAFILAVILALRTRPRKPAGEDGELLYSIRRGGDGALIVHAHGAPAAQDCALAWEARRQSALIAAAAADPAGEEAAMLRAAAGAAGELSAGESDS